MGFFAVSGHGVDARLIEDAHEQALAFFALPLADRMTAAKPDDTYPYGYVPISVEALNRSIGGTDAPDRRRLTMPFFHNANWDARIESMSTDGASARYQPVLAGPYLMAKFRATVSDVNPAVVEREP